MAHDNASTDVNLHNKELYYLYREPDSYNFKHPSNALADILNKYFHPAVQQRFVRNFMKDSAYRSLHLFHSTGSGKTLGSLYVANEYVNAYKRIYKNNRIGKNIYHKNTIDLSPTVFILGFGASQKVFKKDIMKYSDFGIINQEELIQLQLKENQSKSGIQSDIKEFKEYKDRIKRRITNKEKGGFYQFLGYEEVVNRLFYSNEHTLNELEKEAEKTGIELEKIYEKYLANGSIQINEEFLRLFDNSFILCDEIHLTYNNAKKNDRGIALQYILTKTRPYLLTLSATPIKGAPKECIDWINYHMAANKQPLLNKDDFFMSDKEMAPGRLKEFGEITRGYVSFFQDINYNEYPERIFVGEQIILSEDMSCLSRGNPLPYLRFTPCQMSQLHQRTYDEYIGNKDNEQSSEEMKDTLHNTGKISIGARAILDIVFPNPDDETIGIFKSNEIGPKISSATPEWRQQNGVDMKKTTSGIMVATGPWLHLSTLKKYSSKYASLIETVLAIIKSHKDEHSCKKTMIYHHKVRGSGVLLIQEILLQNGFIDEFSNPTDHTICWVCGVQQQDHPLGTNVENSNTLNTKSTHSFYPARFVIAHSNIEKAVLDISLDKFNHTSNKNGLYYGILLGSKMISESYDFKDIQEMHLLSVPINISSLIQTFGRAIRKNASIQLPPDQRKTNIRIYVSTCKPDGTGLQTMSYEVSIYADKLGTYTYIQQIEREIIKNAIDIKIHWDTIMKPIKEDEPTLGALWFPKPELEVRPINMERYNNYEFGDEEVLNVIYLIKRLFLESPVYTYDALFMAIKEPRIPMSFNTKLISENNFIIALSFILNGSMIYKGQTRVDKFVESIFNPHIRIINRDSIEYKLKQVSDYFILFPVHTYEGDKMGEYHTYTYNISDDVETYMRPMKDGRYQRVDITKYLQGQESSDEYLLNKKVIIDAINANKPITTLLYDYSERFQIRILEEAILQYTSSPKSTEQNKSNKLQPVIDLYRALDAVIMSDEILLYSDILKYYDNQTIEKGIPIGYCIRNNIKLYDNKSKWFEISKINLNRHIKYRENQVILGYLQDELDVIKFKLMPPTSTKGKDRRHDVRGMVCAFRDKHEVMEIAASLGISLKKFNDRDLRIANVCSIIRDFLIDREMKDRTRGSQFKWVYGFWS